MDLEAFRQYDWPGNVRELENLVERLIVTTENDIITPDALPFPADIEMNEENSELDLESFMKKGFTLQDAIEEVEERWLRRAYRQYKTT